MKQISVAVAISAMGFAGAVGAFGAPGEDPIKDGQTAVTPRAAAGAGTDPIKDGQTFMAASGNDLGAVSPTRPDVSIAPGWHAFAYDRQGVRFIQVNDGDGVVRVVIAVSVVGNIALPLGVDASHVTFGPASIGATTIYADGVTEIETVAGEWFVHPASR